MKNIIQRDKVDVKMTDQLKNINILEDATKKIGYFFLDLRDFIVFIIIDQCCLEINQ